MAQNYRCTRCEWAGGECSRDDHYPTCPECGAVVDVLTAGKGNPDE